MYFSLQVPVQGNRDESLADERYEYINRRPADRFANKIDLYLIVPAVWKLNCRYPLRNSASTSNVSQGWIAVPEYSIRSHVSMNRYWIHTQHCLGLPGSRYIMPFYAQSVHYNGEMSVLRILQKVGGGEILNQLIQGFSTPSKAHCTYSRHGTDYNTLHCTEYQRPHLRTM